jgi:hypothetical protein
VGSGFTHAALSLGPYAYPAGSLLHADSLVRHSSSLIDEINCSEGSHQPGPRRRRFGPGAVLGKRGSLREFWSQSASGRLSGKSGPSEENAMVRRHCAAWTCDQQAFRRPRCVPSKGSGESCCVEKKREKLTRSGAHQRNIGPLPANSLKPSKTQPTTSTTIMDGVRQLLFSSTLDRAMVAAKIPSLCCTTSFHAETAVLWIWKLET